MSDPLKFPRRQAWKDFLALVLSLCFLTIIFRFSNLDIRLEHYFYSPEKGWMIQYKPVWDFIYRFGIFPGYFLAFCGLIMISLSYWNKKYIRFRKISLLLVFTIIVGPGILVNLVLKDHTGRPRPREISEFGGTENYLCICEVAKNNEGKSFPCGHCSMGFYLAIPYLFYRGRKRILAHIFLVIGLGYGILIGIARMMAGGHFASDVVWAGGLTWGIALIGYYLFRLDKPIEINALSDTEQKMRARRATLVIGILLPIITIGLLLATPYFSEKYFDVSRSKLSSFHCKVVELDLKDAVVNISTGMSFHLDYKVNAFGFPNSKIRGLWVSGDTSHYIIQDMGWFTEVKNVVNIEFPAIDTISWLVRVNHGKIIYNQPDTCRSDIHFFITKGNLFIRSHSASLNLKGNASQIVDKRQDHSSIKMNRTVLPGKPLVSFDLQDGIVVLE